MVMEKKKKKQIKRKTQPDFSQTALSVVQRATGLKSLKPGSRK
jgi:hypothetical protein